MSRRTRIWAVSVWAVLVVLGSGATLLLHDEPPAMVAEYGVPSEPAPVSTRPPGVADLPCPDQTPGDSVLVDCAYRTAG